MMKNVCILCSIILFNVACDSRKKVIEHFSNRQVKLECDISQDKKNGECFEYFPSGKLKGISHWKNDTLNGPTKIYYEAGNILEENNWKNGLLNGEYKSYYVNGKLKEKSSFINGKLHGFTKVYNEDGSLNSTTHFDHGVKLGIQTTYHPNGQVAGIYEWVYVMVMNGKLVNATNTKVEYDQKGKVIHQSHYAEIHFPKDTFSLEEELSMDVELKYPTYDRMKVLIGHFDEHYMLQDSIHVDTLEGLNGKAIYKIKATKLGLNKVRGIVRDYKEEKNKAGGKNTYLEDFYFERDFYVKPKLNASS